MIDAAKTNLTLKDNLKHLGSRYLHYLGLIPLLIFSNWVCIEILPLGPTDIRNFYNAIPLVDIIIIIATFCRLSLKYFTLKFYLRSLQKKDFVTAISWGRLYYAILRKGFMALFFDDGSIDDDLLISKDIDAFSNN